MSKVQLQDNRIGGVRAQSTPDCSARESPSREIASDRIASRQTPMQSCTSNLERSRMSSRAPKTSKEAIGIDFGTTNSSIACADCSDEVQLAKFPYLGSLTDSYRSLLYLQRVKRSEERRVGKECRTRWWPSHY